MPKIYAQDPVTVRDYILKSQRGDKKEDQIKWKLKTLSAREQSLIDDETSIISDDGKVKIPVGTTNRLILDIALMGVENFTDRKGNQIKVEREEHFIHEVINPLKDEFVDRLGKHIFTELANAISNGPEFDEQDLKNS